MKFSVSDIYDIGIECGSCGAQIDSCGCGAKDTRIIRPMFRGDNLIFDVQVQKSPYPGTPPVPIDITGYFMWFTAKRSTNDSDTQALTQITTTPTSVPPGGSIVLTQPTVGKAEITTPQAMTSAFPDGVVKIVYDVKVRDTSSRVFTVEAGTIVVYPNVTRSS